MKLRAIHGIKDSITRNEIYEGSIVVLPPTFAMRFLCFDDRNGWMVHPLKEFQPVERPYVDTTKEPK